MAINRQPYYQVPDIRERLRKLTSTEAPPPLLDGGGPVESAAVPAVAAPADANTTLGMPNDVVSAGIGAVANLGGGLFKDAAAKRRQQQDMEFDATNMKFKNLSAATQRLGEGQRNAMERLVSNLRGTI